MNPVQLDTSTVATDTIAYLATDDAAVIPSGTRVTPFHLHGKVV
jgi:hypothetical protein